MENVAYVDGDAIPSTLTREQVLAYFPAGLRGLKTTYGGAPTFANADGSLTLEVNTHYRLAPAVTPATVMVNASNDSGGSGTQNPPNSNTPSQSVARRMRRSDRPSQHSNNQSDLSQVMMSMGAGGGGQPISPDRLVGAGAEGSDDEIGVIISPQRQLVRRPAHEQQHEHPDEGDSRHGGSGGMFTNGSPNFANPLSQLIIRRGKLIMDRVHDHIMMPPLCCRIVDTPEFQRLRYLKQLGSTQYVYPGATHTRFEHSIGVCHLAGLMAKKIARRQPELKFTDMDILCVMVAGLCHDIGHGPFSHLFEVVVNEALERSGSGRKWHHEEMSTLLVKRIFKRLREENDETVQNIKDEDINFIVLAINGLKPGKEFPSREVGRPDSKRCLLDIVANKRNGIDVDKLDYFQRDSGAIYGKASVDCHISRLISTCRAIRFEGEMQICFEEKMALSLGDIFSVRAKLHKYAYQHRTTKVVDNMIRDALMAAEPYFLVRGTNGRMLTFVECIDDPEGFCALADWILNAIGATSDPLLQPARDIIHRLHTRQLYSLVGGAQLRQDRIRSSDIKQQILNHVKNDDRVAVSNTLVCELVRITYGSSDSSGLPDDPVNHVTFYNPKISCDEAFRLANDRRNPLFSPMAFSESTLLVMCRDKALRETCIEAFNAWKRASERFLENSIPTYNSPAPSRRQRETVMSNFSERGGGGTQTNTNTPSVHGGSTGGPAVPPPPPSMN